MQTPPVIHGSFPYLTSDSRITKVTAIDDLLNIKLSNGIKITPSTNTSTVINPIVLPVVEQSLSDID
ncbi:hypothetical protein [Gilliamella sp. Pas-s25]|uniref:hypothetical protein n=1 Tax=Gilliamella sp. Pas-s25 TaxID=2687310 RepID=UPI00135ED436|nr:hypothetical protein [Gilliamella sp. Pas-s25]MWP62634.1 hypothetical protein [Gilliamella sp. Pas-s25]